MDANELIGLIAAALTTGAFVPQAWRTWRTRSAADFSTGWVVLFGTGVALWLGYGLVLGSVPLIASNTVTLALVAAIAWVKFMPQTPARGTA
ncbi:MAG: SemiSWEET transporter [Alphaproteobacteria bacterium]|nr:SemiSWEET transporter [Alphaproteobacteria bacterium]